MSDKVGKIFEKVSYVFSTPINAAIGCPEELNNLWDDEVKNKAKMEKVYPTYPIDASNSKTLISAKKWQKNKSKTKIVTVNNDPIKNIRIFSLEFRNQGGRAYKLLIDSKYYVDLREDVLMDILLNAKVENGIIEADLIWATVGSQVKLIRVNSEIYNNIKNYQNKVALPKINKNDLVVGGVYETINRKQAIFVGYVDTVKFSYAKEKALERNKYYINNYNYYNNTNLVVDFTYNSKVYKKYMLLYDIYFDDKIPKNITYNNENDLYIVVGSSSFIKKIGQIQINKDLINKIQNYQFNQIIKEFVTSNNRSSKLDLFDLENKLLHYSELFNMVPAGQPLKPFNIKNYLPFL